VQFETEKLIEKQKGGAEMLPLDCYFT